jgi:hypothetical protein
MAAVAAVVVAAVELKRLQWAGHVPWIGETRNAWRILIRKPPRKWPLGKLRK